ncbi:DNA recombination protein RmuC [Canibacter zhoujuaniae]|uniref:DNA recombination protein RmuC n=1 Tax=Canibacter zhoujuaniae TaxID=2708343 RepID=UPI00141FBF61|nr:DNA recombination protein RmuC [Canibacter zhoujuaniae]
MNTITALFVVLAALLAGAGFAYFITKAIWSAKLESAAETARLTATQQTQAELAPQLTAAETARSAAERECAAAQAQLAALREQIAQYQERETERANQQAEEREIITTLGPIRETLDALQKRVNTLDKTNAEKLSQLFTQLGKSQQAEQQLLGTAQQLANTLSNTNKRGSWGEMTLKRLLEQSHLQPNIDYFEQAQTDSADDNGRPDFIVKVPGGGSIVIDAKVPLLDSTAEGVDENKLHIALAKKINGHISKLSTRNYADVVDGSPSFVIAFLPSEAILSQALNGDSNLLSNAFKKRVVLATPVTLWSVLESVAGLWRQAKVTEEAQEVINLGRRFTAGLAINSRHLGKLGRTLTTAAKDYNQFLGSFERSAISPARKLAEINPDLFDLGKELTAVTERPRDESDSKLLREFAAGELTAAPETAPETE